MKKWITILLIFTLLLGLCACESSNEAEEIESLQSDPGESPVKPDVDSPSIDPDISGTVTEPTDTPEPEVIPYKTEIAIGYDYYVYLSDEGDIWTWGNNDYRQLGRENYNNDKPTKITSQGNFIDIETCRCVSAALTADGKLYTFGYNQYGQLGNGTSGRSNVRFKPECILENVVSYAVSNFGGAAITKDGNLHAWGYSFGKSPQILFSNAKSVKASDETIAVVTDSGELYIWGDLYLTDYYVEDDMVGSFTPPCKVLDDVRDVFLHPLNGGFAAVLNNGDLYACGIYGNERSLTKILSNVDYAVLGEGGSRYDVYLLAVTTDKSLYLYGPLYESESGDLGTGHRGDKNHSAPIKLLDNVESCVAATAHCYAITSDNKLYKWGDGSVVMEDVACAAAHIRDNSSGGYSGFAVITTDGSLYLEQAGTLTKYLDDVVSIEFGEHIAGAGTALTATGEYYLICNPYGEEFIRKIEVD